MSESLRWSDAGVVLADLVTHVGMHCPECDDKALVHPTGENLAIIDELLKTHTKP